jgi:hypothetical protein
MTAGLGELTYLVRTAMTASTAVRGFRLSVEGEPQPASTPNERRVAVHPLGSRLGRTCGWEQCDRRIPKGTGTEPVTAQGEPALVEPPGAGAPCQQSPRISQIPFGGLDFRRSVERARILVAGDQRRLAQGFRDLGRGEPRFNAGPSTHGVFRARDRLGWAIEDAVGMAGHRDTCDSDDSRAPPSRRSAPSREHLRPAPAAQRDPRIE